MPTITATPLPAYGWVRLELDWAGWPREYAGVERVVPSTGEVTPIRPHTDYLGWAVRLSNDRAMLYDTEAPLDVPFYYRTSSPNDPERYYYQGFTVRDGFTRTSSSGWSAPVAPELGQAYTTSGGAASDYSISGGSARQTHTSVNVLRHAWTDVGVPDHHVMADPALPVLPTGGGASMWVLGRVTDAANYYFAQVLVATGGAASLVIGKRVAGVLTGSLVTVAGIGTHVAGHRWRIILDVNGYTLRAKAWNLNTQAEPAAYQATVADSSLATGNGAGFASRLESGNTNTLPVVVDVNNLYVSPAAAPPSSYTGLTTLASGGGFWLRSPLKPYKDRRLLLRGDGTCPPAGGIYFVGMDARESYEANGTVVAPANRKLGMAISRPRRGVSSTLSLVTRTFADRDAVLDTMSDGTPVQVAAPPAYGLPARYLAAGVVDVQRGMADHRFQPRLITLPYTEVGQPAGPGAGVLGARHRDLCKTYATWDAAAAASVTYDDMIKVS